MNPLLEIPAVDVSEGQESSAVMGGSGSDTPLCIRVGAAHGEGECPVPISESWWVPLLELLWLHLDEARSEWV